jgi:hypothetical protein
VETAAAAFNIAPYHEGKWGSGGLAPRPSHFTFGEKASDIHEQVHLSLRSVTNQTMATYVELEVRLHEEQNGSRGSVACKQLRAQLQTGKP